MVIPMGVIIFLFSKEIVAFVLGDKWLELIPILKILSFFIFNVKAYGI